MSGATVNFTRYSLLAAQSLIRKLQRVPVATKLWVFHTAWACFTSSTPTASDTKHSHRASQTQGAQIGLSFQLRHPPTVLPTFLWVTAATQRKKLLPGTQASWETSRSWSKNKDGRLEATGDRQEADDKKFYVRKYHRHKNSEKIISQQAPFLLLHTVWRGVLEMAKVFSDWRGIKHTLTSMVTHTTGCHLILIMIALYGKLNFHNFFRGFLFSFLHVFFPTQHWMH